MKKIKFLFVHTAAALLTSVFGTYAQTSFNPTNLGKAINSEYSEINPVISRMVKLYLTA